MVRLVAVAALALACGGGDSPTGGSNQESRLSTAVVKVSGLPSGTSAVITLAGGSGAPRAIAATDTVRGLQPGRYVITAGETANDTAYFSPATIEQTIDVGEQQTILVSVDYAIASATLALRLSGVPDGILAQLTVTGADSVPRTLTSSAVLRRLRPGTYRISAAPISIDLDVYRPPGFPRTVSLSASSTITEVDIAYGLASGRLAFSSLGLPSGTRPQGVITSPHQPDIAFTSDTVLTGLAPGRYNIYPAPVTVAGKIYATVEYSTTVEVPASRTAVTARVTYHPPVGRLTIRTSGLPRGTTARVQLGYSWLQEVDVTDVLTRTDVPVGLLGVYAQRVDVPTGLYEPREVLPHYDFLITPDSTVEMTIRYELLTGLLAINVHGLPPGVDANLSFAPPQEDPRTLTRSQIVRVYRGHGGLVALNVQSRKEGFVATEFAKSFFVDTGTTPVPIDIHYASVGPLNITVTAVRVMQQTFRPAGTVPLVAGKEAIVSAFVHGDTTNGAKPTVRARLYRYGQLEHTIVFPPLQFGLPTSVALDNVLGVVNTRIPGQFVQPGLSVVVDVDSDNMFDEPNETDNVFPRTQVPLAVRVGAVHPIAVKFVPIAQAGNFLIGDVTDANAATFLSKTRRMFPLGDISATVRATFGVTVPLSPDNSDGSWLTAASEFAALHAAEGGGYHYYGVVRTAYTSGIAGIGLIPGRVALGWDFHPTATSIMAHELGHNFGLLHTRCGTTDGLDPDFPHGGSIGHGGFDLMMNREYGRDTPDFMGYCDNSWISDYSFEKIFNGVVVGSPPARQAAPRGPEPGVLIWGRVQNDRPVLEPAFDVHALPSLPTRPGRHTLEVVGEDGTALLRVAFSGERVDHGRSSDEVFAFVIPLSALRGQRPARLRLTSSGRSVVVERAAAVLAAPLATRGTGAATRVSSDNAATRGMLIRDARTREILAISRGEAATIATQAPELEVTWSDGVRSTTRRIVVR